MTIVQYGKVQIVSFGGRRAGRRLQAHIWAAEKDAERWAGSGLAALRRRDAEILRGWLGITTP